ncbi:class I SAM-dependent methyltransferase [Magnetospira sp. QH-2]|uniref:class I SAM-dependent methyltransferase n=1 Tax=Magnetospira sp. (strain QH-2) TaxID=1288970 RepID=UPI0003E81724|nr:class I SAM-dependent methyltransferase [Magnetospira sp. QH-2]CCQ75207.1 conserved protein of unknown function [Magnetospira sp. QH-2]
MSRLDSFIRRMTAQRDCLNRAAALIADIPGPVLELGLGNGRTYDHLRTLFPEREVFVFEIKVAAHPDCIPDADHLLLGDFRDTVPRAILPSPAALVHADVGSGRPKEDGELARFLGEHLQPLLRPDGLIVCDQDLAPQGWRKQPLPQGIAPDRYHIYQR